MCDGNLRFVLILNFPTRFFENLSLKNRPSPNFTMLKGGLCGIDILKDSVVMLAEFCHFQHFSPYSHFFDIPEKKRRKKQYESDGTSFDGNIKI